MYSSVECPPGRLPGLVHHPAAPGPPYPGMRFSWVCQYQARIPALPYDRTHGRGSRRLSALAPRPHPARGGGAALVRAAPRARTAPGGGGAAGRGERRLLHPAGAGQGPERVGRRPGLHLPGAAPGRDRARLSARGRPAAEETDEPAPRGRATRASRHPTAARQHGTHPRLHPRTTHGRARLERPRRRGERLQPHGSRAAQRRPAALPGAPRTRPLPRLRRGRRPDRRPSAAERRLPTPTTPDCATSSANSRSRARTSAACGPITRSRRACTASSGSATRSRAC